MIPAEHFERIANELRRRAKHGLFDGRGTPEAQRYIRHCRVLDQVTQACLIFTRDSGHHTSGWLKNPDYERCWHLSTSPLPSALILPGHLQRGEPDAATTRRWVEAFFGDDQRYLWAESPKTPEGKARGVWHWRLFCDERWQPILPRKEVYSLDFTELGWRSASQVLAEDGLFLSETEDGREIVSSVDPR